MLNMSLFFCFLYEKHAFQTCEKNEKNVKKKHLNILLGRWNFDFLWVHAGVTLLPVQLLQVENRRGAVQIDRMSTAICTDLFNISIAKQ